MILLWSEVLVLRHMHRAVCLRLDLLEGRVAVVCGMCLVSVWVSIGARTNLKVLSGHETSRGLNSSESRELVQVPGAPSSAKGLDEKEVSLL